jgi:uncharacterized low-complexity protein
MTLRRLAGFVLLPVALTLGMAPAAAAEVKTVVRVQVLTFVPESGKTEVLGGVYAKGKCGSRKRELKVVKSGTTDTVKIQVLDRRDTPRGFQFNISVGARAPGGSYQVLAPATRRGRCGEARSQNFRVD